jgi:CheY-like chemotaxis protein
MIQETTDVLLVEDNPNDALLAIRSLKENKLANEIVHLKDGQEAIDYLLQQGSYTGKKVFLPKVILLDLKLPKVNGLEVLKALRAHPETKLVPIVILTSSQVESDLIESYKLGANSYIVKPVDFENFSKSIREVGLYWLILNKPPILKRTP